MAALKELRWETPPPSSAGRPNVYLAVIEALKERPGEWAIVAVSKSGDGSITNAAKKIGVTVQTVTRPYEENGSGPMRATYARYVPDEA